MEGKRIFIVDDDDGSRFTAQGLLKPDGYDVTLFASAAEAMAVLESGAAQPDLVLADVMMPGMNGFDLCRHIKERFGALIPVVLYTALDSSSDKVEGLRAGADDFLTKPIHGAELRARVRNLAQVSAYRRLLQNERDRARDNADDLRAQLVTAERLASIGTFAAGIAHELKNIAAVLNSCVGSFVPNGDSYVLDAEAVADLKAASTFVADLSGSVLRIARPNVDDPSVQLELIVGTVIRMLRATGRTKFIDVRTQLPNGETWCNVRTLHAQQILLNLIGNAADALDGQRGARIDVSMRRSSAWVELAVTDNGPGIPPEVLKRVGEPFFTTKRDGVGTGLGVSVVRQLVESWKGTFAITSEVGIGTTVTVTLPAMPKTPALSGAPSLG